MHGRHIILLSVACLAAYFSAYLINGTIFVKSLLKIKCVFMLSEKKIFILRTFSQMLSKVHLGPHVF